MNKRVFIVTSATGHRYGMHDHVPITGINLDAGTTTLLSFISRGDIHYPLSRDFYSATITEMRIVSWLLFWLL
jgi:hypothetical protein